MPNVPGKQIVLGGKEFILPPMNAATFKTYKADIAKSFGETMPEMDKVAQWLHACLVRNYPDLELSFVEEWVDSSNMFDFFEAVIDLNGLVEKAGNMVRRVQEKALNLASTSR